MSKKRKMISLGIFTIFIALILGVVGLYNKQANALEGLGYTDKEAKAKINYSNFFNIANKEKESLSNDINHKKDVLRTLGINNQKIDEIKLTNNELVTDLKILDKTEDTRVKYLNTEINKLETKAKQYNIKINYSDDNLYQKYLFLSNTLEKNYSKLIKKYYNLLQKNGYSKKELLKLYSKNNKASSLLKFEKLYNKEKKKKKKQASYFQSKELQNSAMRMFRETNEYRKSLGLKPYSYNYEMQACVLKEAKAYASNGNPHNWLCKAAANENAGIASKKSDYVKLAMDFFKSDPPHEAVLSGNYNSVAISMVEKNGTVYMIMDVFY